MDYIGLKCGVCGEDFVEDDDVVVCPDCGTPMHRACFAREGGCPNRERHGGGFVFDGFEKIKRSAQGKSDEEQDSSADAAEAASVSAPVCPVCGVINRHKANFCDHCGTRLSVEIPAIDEDDASYIDPQYFASVMIGRNTDVAAGSIYEDGVSAGDMACYVAINTPYYLGAFKTIKNGGRKFNFSAALFSGVWFMYRKLYKVGALVFSLQILLSALQFYITRLLSAEIVPKLLSTIGLTMNELGSLSAEQYMQLSSELSKLPANEQLLMSLPTLIVVMQIIVMIVCGVIGNSLYYKHCVSRIKEVKEDAAEASAPRAEISKLLYLSGGVNAILAGVCGMIYLFLILL